ncbi:HAD family hydrolase [Mycolicibacterium chlorophenolicum]|uniref:Haloacid dehalogenase-like hydrolase n=1 Tax=Mycolicibacterium chlorophenolicum TaxID=37916 RepID=A0A0J6VPJ3_9MYCO|nr:HAD family hydrolase [Mycolicibacterium chlorophenolicum]KMO71388.1 haloacid dehalogenase-like hydrolase [Mycolicibacterium chlorophenolicum]
MQPTQQKTWRAGRFWWDWPRPGDAAVPSLRAVVFDLDALADIECAGHRPAFNRAFAELGLDIVWSEARYRQLMALSDERRRVAAELRKRGISSECDVLAELLVDEICATKDMILAETILDADITARPGLVDLITEAYAAGISVGIVSSGNHSWVAPLVRQLVGEGVVAAIVTADDAPRTDLYRAALAELGAAPHEALAFAGSPASQRMSAAAGLPTMLTSATADAAPLRVVDCQRVRDQWRVAHPVTAA